MMIGGPADGGAAARPDLHDAGARASATSRARRAASDGQRHGRTGLPALRRQRRRPLREDGAQRHRVRPDGRLCRRPEHPASTPTSASSEHAADAETTPLRDPEHYQYDLNLPDIAEVWRRGSVISSWLLDLTAAALAEDPSSGKFAGRVSDSGEGRWTHQGRHRRGRARAGADAPRCTSASARAARPISRTSCCRRCASSSAATTRSRPANEPTRMPDRSPTRWCSSAPPATWPTRRSSRRCRRWSSAATWTCR